MIFYHVDVFSSKILSGNGLTVIFHEEDMSKDYMQAIAQEFKQFETIFLRQIEEKRFRARIFTVEEELDFAGHPILGAMAVIHEKLFAEERNITAVFELNNKSLQGESVKKEGYFQATMNQGTPAFLGTVEGESVNTFLQALNLTTDYLHPSLPMEVVSTGLPYLIVPLTSGLEKARISVGDFEEQLGKVQAKFVYLFDVDRMEGRTWDNGGASEDVATGSAAGPTGAYLYKWNIFNATDDITINQGGFVGRPSKIKVFADQSTGDIKVSGDVKIIAKGQLLI
ncbi:PhzF family phenazine biosynthesis protein [Anaerotignum propionicum]|uniref:Isomerase YddE n=1 Tax=Anaerotignum propionicum DSM 1682 TaxID=991789 RepID=A0A0X8VB73_ANAPI|nr:PhzF family phenazine biosynthesis protein [Anaerotignum propionicum]AMJ41804.1 putative isomerase YddE [Anaerotignum propionicum DSM 1682]SHE84955.1 phenazine biosynthesis protein PhzF family [[Clostridium] propionicum DSM 1682] [Anaerotignum propionicum DSM 1682]